MRLLSSRRCPHTRRGTAQGCVCARSFSRSPVHINTDSQSLFCTLSCDPILRCLFLGSDHSSFGHWAPESLRHVPIIFCMYLFSFCSRRSCKLISCISCPSSRISRFSGWGLLLSEVALRTEVWRWVCSLLSRCQGLLTSQPHGEEMNVRVSVYVR